MQLRTMATSAEARRSCFGHFLFVRLSARLFNKS